MKRPVPTTFSVLALALLAGCPAHRPIEAGAPAVARVEGNRVVLPPDAIGVTAVAVGVVERPRSAIVHLNGRLVWDEDATVRIYSPVTGRVRSVMANVGDHVTPELPLALIDSPDFGQAHADGRKADADALLAQRTLDRVRELYTHGAAPRKDVEAAEDALAGAEAERDRAAARLALYGSRRADPVNQAYALRSPIPGTVVERNLNLGQELRPDLMLANAPQLLAPQFVVSDPTRLWVALDVTEMDLGLLRPGTPLRISSRALPGRVFRGTLESLGSALDPTTRTLRARGSVENTGELLKAEMYVDVEVDVRSNEAQEIQVASPALITKEERTYVFVEVSPHVFERREVRVGSEGEGKAVLLDGVRPGERVLIEGGLLVESVLEGGARS